MAKYSDKIPEDKIEQVIEGTVTPEQVSEEVGVPVSAVHNKKSRIIQKKKLTVGYSGVGSDQSLPKTNLSTSQKDNTKTNEVPLDATEALKGFWSLIDMLLSMGSFLTNGQLEYEKLKPEDISGLAQVSNNNETMRKIATVQGADMMIILGYAGMKFAPRIKLNKFPKHNEVKSKEFKCKCEECTKKLEDAKNKIKKSKELVNQVIETNVGNDANNIHKVIAPEIPSEDAKLKEFLQRNLGSDSQSLKEADNYIERMKNAPEGQLKITG